MKKNILVGTMVLGLVLGLFGIASISNAAVAIVSAGANQTITLPTSVVTLTGSAAAFTPATITSQAWTQTSGSTSGIVITTPTALSTTVTGFSTAGSYVFTLTATDSTASTGSASVTITVNPAGTNQPPIDKIKSKLEINPNGKVNLQGELMSIGTGILSVKVWGITFAVNTATVQFNGKVLDITGYKLGDMISVSGKLDASAPSPTIIARNIKNMTAQVIKYEQNSKSLKETMKDNRWNKENDRGRGNDR